MRRLLFVVALLVSTVALGQFQASQPVTTCGNCSGWAMESQGYGCTFQAGAVVGNLAVLSHGNVLEVYSVASPLSPVRVGAAVPLLKTPGGATWESGVTDHIRGMYTTAGWNYIYVGLFSYGWDLFDPAGHKWLGVGFSPATALKAEYAALYVNARPFVAGGRFYLAGPGLVSNTSKTVAIFDVTAPAKLTTPVALLPLLQGVSATFTMGGRVYLAGLNTSGGLSFYDVTVPASPVLAAAWASAVVPVFDGPHKRGYVANATSGVAVLDLTSLTAPVSLGTVLWYGAAGPTTGTVSLAVGDTVLYVSDQKRMGALTTTGALPVLVATTTVTPYCSNPWYSPFYWPPVAFGDNVLRPSNVYFDTASLGGVVIPTPTVPIVGTPTPAPTFHPSTPTPVPTPGGCPPCPCLTPTPTPPAASTPTPPIVSGSCINPATGACSNLAPQLGVTTCPAGWTTRPGQCPK